MRRHTLTSVMAAATLTIACGGSPQTTDDEAVTSPFSNDEAQAPSSTTAIGGAGEEAVPVQSATAETPAALPDTASPLALIGLGGALSLAGAAGIRALRRR